ncbi:MAG: hypothetical protein QW390_04250 [Candidatus Bathyarchaeia archaeon]
MGRTDRTRPFPMGVSVGHYKVTAGTAGCIAVDSEGKEHILSNNHVLANSNDAEPGDPVYQPGVYDGGTEADTVALLTRYIPIRFPDSSGCPLSRAVVRLLNAASTLLGRRTRFYTRVEGETPENEVDAAIARPTEPERCVCGILEGGRPRGSARAVEGEAVRKSGRTTGLTEGVVFDDDATIEISYGASKALFVHQILVRGDRFIQGGDSGSALLNGDGYVVGLLFAGSGDGALGVANHIYRVEELLGVRVRG